MTDIYHTPPDLLAAARRMLDMLTLDGEPNALAIPSEIVAGDQVNEFAQAFDALQTAVADAEGRAALTSTDETPPPIADGR